MEEMKKSRVILWAVVLIILAILALLLRYKMHFHWSAFSAEVRSDWSAMSTGIATADRKRLLFGVVLIYVSYWIRALRWAILLKPQKKVRAMTILGSQFIGFTAVALFGRLADLTRPYLIARRTGLTLASQIATYTLERMFDLGAAALIFSSALVLTPKDAVLPHREIFIHVGVFSLLLTVTIALFAFGLRIAGEAAAFYAEKVFSLVSPKFGAGIGGKIRAFREGMNALSTFRDFLAVSALSLLMWGMIALVYLEVVHSFVNTPELATRSFQETMLLMGASIGGSLLQFPVLGWFTQIGITAEAMHTFFNAPGPAATACGALLLAVTFLAVIPVGLIYARIEGVSLRKAAVSSETAAEEIL